jgi:Protein of unknown function (DUF3616)
MTSSISFLGSVKIVGNIYNDDKKNKNISAIEIVGDRLIVGADEGNKIKILKHNGESYAVERGISLSNDEEIDIEGIACEGSIVYVVGSHSYKREQIDANRTYEQNRNTIKQKFSESDREQRDRLFRLNLNGDPKIEQTSLRSTIDRHDLLQLFSKIPSKENGIDIEGMAVRNGLLYVGFRGPVLRDNWVPILKCKFATLIDRADLVFVNLGGRGIRDLTPVNDGFLILAGPVGEGEDSYQIYAWDGEDCLPGTRTSGLMGQIELLGEIPVYDNTKAEGIALMAESHLDYEVIIVFDGVANGNLTRLRITKKSR